MMVELLTQRRSIRKFKDKKIEKKVQDRLLKAALLSPSSRNIRPWTFVAVDDPETILQLSRAKLHGSAFLASAPLAVAVTADPAECDVWVEDASVASAVLLFAAEAAGLGACWCQIRLRPHDEGQSAENFVRGLLQIPESQAVAAVIGIGYPDEHRPPYTGDDLRIDKLRYNGFHAAYRLSDTRLDDV